MFLVAIRPRAGDEAPERIATLCDASGLPRYEAATRIRVLAGWPGILVSLADEAHAEAIADGLRRARFDAWTRPGVFDAARLDARRFAAVPGGLQVESDGGERIVIGVDAARLLLVGTDFRIETEHVVDRDLGGGNVGTTAARALLGLPTMATIGRTVERRREHREGFARLFANGCPPIHFRASRLQYAALDGQDLAPTRTENFARALERLRSVLPRAEVDNRLVARAAQVRILGPGLPPTRHLETAIALLAGDAAASTDPYR